MNISTSQAQQKLDLHPPPYLEESLPSFSGPCALEDDEFPFEAISDIAELESWRKEINRPLYHIHKWWAQRLGAVFRAITIGALTPSGTDVLGAFYRPTRIRDAVIFDPFMGSGTTIGEALKLGARAIGRDINPVAHFLVHNALSIHGRTAVLQTFEEIEQDVADEIKQYYKARLPCGTEADVLYYFWVKQVECPECSSSVDLFSTRIFAKHTYPKQHPQAQALCPGCGEVNPVLYDAQHATCIQCSLHFNPQQGPAKGQKATCPDCAHSFPIAKIIRRSNEPPKHRLYAKLILTPDGKKIYAAATADDCRLYENAATALADRSNAYPIVAIEPGHNTNQALGYNYRYWHEMFNQRQLLCLSMLADRIRKVSDPALRDLFTCLFSGALEFNNIFASYKGEGTGAVRHIFAHHILKPERVPLEANVWGTPSSSGSFMTMFHRRILRALDYAENAFELRLCERKGRKVSDKIYGLSEAMGFEIVDDFRSFQTGKRVYLSCGDSGVTDLDDQSVNAIITDPPFFDNVHYSELADFFHVWQRHLLGDNGNRCLATTRSEAEVQNAEVNQFAVRLASVWSECYRVLADEGVLAFTYHHSRPDGWRPVLQALMEAGFAITAAHPVKAEMSVAMPKSQAKEPIDLDIILVCRKRFCVPTTQWKSNPWDALQPKAATQVCRLINSGRRLSRNDVRIIIMAQLIQQLSRCQNPEKAMSLLDADNHQVESLIDSLHVVSSESNS